ncbi:MAG: carbon starvation protein A [Planctomycetota bacterium]|nr:carbon starvation protein A [Planctomycetota bacterium]
MNAAVLAAVTLLVFYLAHRFYARWLERRVFETDTDEPTPAHLTPDGVDFVPCGKHVLFGHHFCSVAGAAPIVGPAIAVIWGWLPALLWVVIGTALIGAVHDFGALAISAKKGGRTMGDIAADVIGPRAKVQFLGIIVLLTWVVIAVFAYLIAVLFKAYPQSVWPVNFEILVALGLGWWVYRRGGKLLWPSILAVVLLYAVVFWCADKPELGTLPASVWVFDTPVVTWILFLLAYAFVASVLPVRVLLQPRDYINSHQLFLGLGALLLGLLILQPEIVAPAFNTEVHESVPPLIPLLFITIACGAISGFHGLVSSGTTSKQLDSMRDARTVGYGGMLGEGVLAMISVLAVSAGFASTDAWRARYVATEHVAADGTVSSVPIEWADLGGRALTNFVDGAAGFLVPLLEPFTAGAFGIAQIVVAVIVISFAATTLDTAARIQRFCLSELGSTFRIRLLANRYVATAVAVVPAGLLAIFTETPGRGPGSGGMILWPVFGTTNQLIGAITLLILFLYLRGRKRPTLPILLPLIFLVVVTTIAGLMGLLDQIRAGNTVVVAFGVLFLLLEVLVFIEAGRRWRAARSSVA